VNIKESWGKEKHVKLGLFSTWKWGIGDKGKVGRGSIGKGSWARGRLR
jgi:hypothetical protein